MASPLVPDPPSDLARRANQRTWSPTAPLFRCHATEREAVDFNPGYGDGGRFHWFLDAAGAKVPVLYAANTYEGAVAETIFRDVPLTGRRFVPAKRLKGRTITQLRLNTKTTFTLVELHDPGLLRLGLRPQNLTETTSYHYKRTAKWAQAVHAQLDWAHGMVWISGRFNTAHVMVLFGDRVEKDSLSIVPGSSQPLDKRAGAQRVIDLGKSVKITVARPLSAI